jgi:hypothetical protein
MFVTIDETIIQINEFGNYNCCSRMCLQLVITFHVHVTICYNCCAFFMKRSMKNELILNHS